MQPYIAEMDDGLLQARTTPCAILKFEYDPVNVDVSALFIQIIDSATTPATGTVPRKSWPAPQALYKEFSAGELQLTKGCFIGLSTTEATYTNSNTDDTFVQIEFTQPAVYGSLTVAGDLTTGVKFLKPWNETNNQLKKLYILEIIASGHDAEALWLLMYGYNNPLASAVSPFQPIALGTQQDYTIANGNAFTFGESGRNFTEYRPSAANIRYACSLMLSTSPATLVAPANATVAMKAWYK